MTARAKESETTQIDAFVRARLAPGDIVKVKVLEVDIPRKRIALTKRLDDAAEPRPKASERVARGQGQFLRQPERKGESALADALRRAAERRE